MTMQANKSYLTLSSHQPILMIIMGGSLILMFNRCLLHHRAIILLQDIQVIFRELLLNVQSAYLKLNKHISYFSADNLSKALCKQ